MNKWLTFFSMIVAGYFLLQFNQGEIISDDVLRKMGVDEPVKVETVVIPSASEYFEPIIKSKRVFENIFDSVSDIDPLFRDIPAAAALDNRVTEAKGVAEFMTELSHGHNVDTFLVFADSSDGSGQVVTSRFGYDTVFGKVEPNFDIIDRLDLPESDTDSAFFVRHMSTFIKKAFPQARIVPIVVEENVDKAELRKLASELAKLDNVFVLGQLPRERDPFKNEMLATAFENLDEDVFDGSTYLFVRYLQMKGTEIAEKQDSAYAFYEGDIGDSDRSLTILAFGDMMLGRYVRTLMNANGLDYVFENMPSDFIGGADVVFGNLEGPIKGEGRSGGTSMVFGFNEDVAPLLVKHGFNLVSISNNHALDQGWSGRDSTIEALDDVGLDWCGHPSEPAADTVRWGRVKDKKYAFACFQDITAKLDDEAAVELIRELDGAADYVIVSVHWGPEYKHTAHYSTEVEPGRAFIDAGADFVIGHHPHVVQNFEFYNGGMIFYSLGNFVFDQYWSSDTQEELAIGIVLNDDFVRVHLYPMKSERSQSRLMTEQERAGWINRFIGYGEYDEAVQAMIRSGVIEFQR